MKFNFKSVWGQFSSVKIFLICLAMLSASFDLKAQSENTLYNISSTTTSVTVTYKGRNACVGNNDFSVIHWYRNGTEVASETVWLQYNEWFDVSHTFTCTDLAPNSNVTIKVVADHYYCVWPYPGALNYTSTSSDYIQTLASYNPVSGVSATNNKYGDRVIVTWSVNEQFATHKYRVYKDGTQVSGDLGAGTSSFTHSGLTAGSSGNYTVRGLVNNSLVSAPSGDNGSAFNINLQATKNLTNKVMLTWSNFSGTNAPTGYYITRTDSTYAPTIENSTSIYATSTEDAATSLTPGYMYTYRIYELPLSNNIVGVAQGKILPNGVISGRVTTPTNIGVPSVQIVATLQGPNLPTDTTRTYTAVTNANGEYTINKIYYYNEATFTVQPVFAGRTFNPASRDVTLNLTTPANTVTNFTDMSSFTVSGTILQDGCPAEGVSMLLDGMDSGVLTDSNGVYNLTVSSGGSYQIKPQLGDHTFSPAIRTESITANTSGINFSDTTRYYLEGHFLASCNTYIGTAQLRIFTTDDAPACSSDTITTDLNGYFSIELPAREYKIDLLGFTSNNETLVPSAEVMAYFANESTINLTNIDSTTFHGDTMTYDFVFRRPAQLVVNNIDDIVTCSGEILPVLNQNVDYSIDIFAVETFSGNTCPAGDGTVIIMENISVDGVTFNYDTLQYMQGDTIHYILTPGTPNIIAPHKKSFDAVLFCPAAVDTVHYDAIVIGHNPRTQTFTTVTPQVPFHIIHNPPGDASYAYLEQNSSISNSFTTSFLQEGSVNAFITVHAGPDQTVSAGIGAEVETEIDVTIDATGTLGFGVSGLTTDASTITSTATQRFETSGSTDMIGGEGDLYIGGALNMLYALSDALLYDFNTCQLLDSVVLMMEPNGIQTTFIYTEKHINEVIIPELQYIVDYYNGLGETDTAAYYQNQLGVWQQVVTNNHSNIASAGTIENKTFSGGTLSEYSATTTRATSHSLEMSYYLDYGVAVELGATISGIGLNYGVAVQGRSTWGNVVSTDTETSTTVGYVLSDDDNGDSYSVDIANDSLYGTPVFRLVAGRSSCPWEDGSQHREGVQLLSDTYYQEAEENDQAVYVLQLSNTSESNESMTYDLIFDHTSNPNGAILTIGGSPVVGNTPYSYTIPAFSSAYATITASKGPSAMQYNNLKFTLQSQCDDQVSQDVYLNALFYKTYDLTVAQVGQGVTFPGTGINNYREGTSVYLYASPLAGYEFQKWIVGSDVYTDPSIAVSMTGNITATAYFVETMATQYNMSVSVTGNGTTVPPAGTHLVNAGSVVDLSANPAAQNAFVKWIVNGNEIYNPLTSIVIDSNTTVEAVFSETNVLTIQLASGQGTTTPAVGPNSINTGDVVHLFASPAQGFQFSKWIIGGVEFTTQSLDMTMIQDTLVQIFFDSSSVNQYELIVSNIGNGTTTPPQGIHYLNDGSTVDLNAYPSPGYLFEKWIIDGVEYTDNPHSLTITSGVMVDAYFKFNNVGISEASSGAGLITAYPNPSTGFIRVESDHVIRELIVFDLFGKMLSIEKEMNENHSDLNLSDVASGTYIIRVTTSQGVSSLKVQILH